MKNRFNNFEEVKEYLNEKKKGCLQAVKDLVGYKAFKDYAIRYKELFLEYHFAFLLCYDLPEEEMEKIKNDFLEEYKKILNK